MFEDREEAGIKLCPKLKYLSYKKNVVVVGLTRGGIVTASAVSKCFGLNLKALVVKKIGAPGNAELAIGAVVTNQDIYWNNNLLKDLGLDKKTKKAAVLQKVKEVKLFEKKLGIKKNKNDYKNKTIILVDDGIATGASVMAANKYLRRNKAKKIILATPVIAYDILKNLKIYFDVIVYLKADRNFNAVGQFYKNFEQVSDEETASLLRKFR